MINSIVILGGGTSGFVSGLILKKQFPDIQIKIIKSKKIGIIGVGEGSTEHWKIFCDIIGVDLNDFIINCDSTIKLGILFDKWSNKPYIHSIFKQFVSTKNNYYVTLAYLLLNNKNLYFPHIKNNLTYQSEILEDNISANQFHFDTYKLNYFLEKKSEECGIQIIYDDILDVEISEEGNISCLISDKGKYYSDLFLDCSGFNRFLLHKKLGVKWISYSKYLPLNSAFTFLTEEMDDYNLWTKATAHKNGWSWKTPTQKRTGNGYVFCDNFTSIDDAKHEMDLFYKRDLEILKIFKFDPGRLEKTWYKNCISIGVSSSFVEPLEATSIGSTIQQIRCLCEYLPSQDKKSYNKIMVGMFENIIDFIQCHYLTEREDTPFWKEIKNNLVLTDSLKENLSIWKHRLPRKSENSNWNLFQPINYIYILDGLNYFNKESLKEEYEYYRNELRENETDKMIFEEENLTKKIKHKDLIKTIKYNYDLERKFKYN